MTKTIGALIALSCLAIALALMLIRPEHRQPQADRTLPWQIEVTADKRLRVFGLTLGSSKLIEATKILGEDIKLGIFRDSDGGYTAEAYFDRVSLNGLRSKMVLSIDATQSFFAAAFARSETHVNLANQAVKAELGSADQQALLQKPILGIAYSPTAQLKHSLLRRQFGQPQNKVQETEQIVHWLYPEKGLDIVIHANGKTIFQYVNPSDFLRLIKPLESKPSGNH